MFVQFCRASRRIGSPLEWHSLAALTRFRAAVADLL